MKAKIYHLSPSSSDSELYTRTHRIDYVEYDGNDNLKRIDELRSSGTDPPAVFSSFKTYDNLDRLETETDSYGRILEYEYDNVGNRASLTDPDGKRTVYEYDDLNRLDYNPARCRHPRRDRRGLRLLPRWIEGAGDESQRHSFRLQSTMPPTG